MPTLLPTGAYSHVRALLFLYLVVQRLHIGSVNEGTRRPTTLLSHADVVAALHRCKYDPASAEASLIALARRREAKYLVASAASDARNSERRSAEQAGGGSVAAGKSTGNTSPKVLADAPPGGKIDIGGNRWEDWSEHDRVAFLTQLGEKVRTRRYCRPLILRHLQESNTLGFFSCLSEFKV